MQDDELFEDYEDGVGGGNSGCDGEIYQEVEPCVSSGGYHILKYACQHDGSPPPHGLGDIPPCDDVCSGTTVTTILDFSDCESATYDPLNGPTNDVSDDSQTDGGTGGDTGNSDTDGSSTITAPVEIEDPNCPAGSGKIMIDEVCVCPEDYKEDPTTGNCVMDPCKTIKKAIDSTTIKQHFNDLKTKLNNSKEQGQIYFKDNGQYNSRKIAVSIFNSNSVSVTTGKTVFGAGHTHTDDLHSMFSWSDMQVLYNLYKKANYDLKDMVMYYLIARDTPNDNPNFYLLKVSDYRQLKNKLLLDIEKIKTIDPRLNSNTSTTEAIDILNETLGNKFDNSNDFEKTFLSEFKAHGIKLYKSKNSVNSLAELTLDNTNNVIETPCN